MAHAKPAPGGTEEAVFSLLARRLQPRRTPPGGLKRIAARPAPLRSFIPTAPSWPVAVGAALAAGRDTARAHIAAGSAPVA